jgi:hypothetical protein
MKKKDFDDLITSIRQAGMIRREEKLRTDWTDAAKSCHESGEDGLLDDPTPTSFDEDEWE